MKNRSSNTGIKDNFLGGNFRLPLPIFLAFAKAAKKGFPLKPGRGFALC